MSKINRRTVLRGSVIATVGAAASAVPSIAAKAAPVSKLPALLKQYLDVTDRSCKATEAREECEFAACKTFPKRPRALLVKRSGYGSEPQYIPITSAEINEWFDQGQEIFKLEGAEKAKHEKQRADRLKLLAEWEAREQAILDRAGLRALKAAEDALDAEADRLRGVIVAFLARTMADVAAKVQFLSHVEWGEIISGRADDPDITMTESAYLSLLADVNRLAGEA